MNERVLVVSSDEAEHAEQCRVLEEAGFAPQAVATLDAAYEAIASWQPAAVLVSISVGAPSDGIAFVKDLRSRADTARLALILLTPPSSLDLGIVGLESGADDYLVTPVVVDELIARVAAQLRARQRKPRGARALWLRAEVVEHISSITATDARTIAQRATRAASSLDDVVGAGVMVLDEPDRSRLLAYAGSAVTPLAVDAVLPPRQSAGLWERALVGPWLQPLEGISGSIAVAPLQGAETFPMGVFILWFREGAFDANEIGDVGLAAAMDIAAALRPILGPALLGRDGGARQRLDIDRIVASLAFGAVFQPVFDVRDPTPSIVGYEALTRFDDMTPPDRRFASATRLGRRHALEVAAIARAIAAARALPERGWLSVNVSPATITEGEDFDRAIEASSRDVVIEITEHDPINDYDALRQHVDAMHPRPQLSVDDASSGYATLRHVLRLAPDFVKIDQTWVRGIDQDNARQAVVGALCGFAEHEGVTLIAEGVEEEAELRTLRSLGVNLAQGFLLGRPAPAATPAT